MVKHFMIGFLPELLQQVKYKGVDTLDIVICTAKKEASLESTLIISLGYTTEVNATSMGMNTCESRQHYLKYYKIYILNQHTNLSVISK